jgi:signal transduction histidine kinase
MLYLCDRIDGQPFTEQDEWLIETMASYACLAIAGSELGEQQSRLTLLEERERISMELHDGVIQSLYAIGMHLELARTGGTVRKSDLDKPINDLNNVIEDIRRYILNLQARDQRLKTIFQSFRELVSRLNIPAEIEVTIDASDDYPPFTWGVFEGVCQIVNEAVSNVLRHADAKHVQITARETEHLFEAMIADDGNGFDLDKSHHTNGLGLKNIQQRAMLYGGRVTIETSPGSGTRIIVTIPT